MERTSICNLRLLTCAHDIDLALERDRPVVPHDGVIHAEHVSALRTLVVLECNLESVAHKAALDHNWTAQGKARVQQRAWTRTRERHGLEAKSGACDTERRLRRTSEYEVRGVKDEIIAT